MALDLPSLAFAPADTRALLDAAITDPLVNVLVCTVTATAAGAAVVGRCGACDLAEWLARARAAHKGVKLCIAEHAALAPALTALGALLPGWESPDDEASEGVGGGEGAAAEGAAVTAAAAAAARAAAEAVAAGPSTDGGVVDAQFPLLRVARGGASSSVPLVIVHADVLTGPGGARCAFNASGVALPDAAAETAAARAFVDAVAAALPLAIVSCGWTTADGAGSSRYYDAAAVACMAAAVGEAAESGVRLAFPLRAVWLRATLEHGTLAPLLALPGAHACVWSPERLAPRVEALLRAAMPRASTCWDVPRGDRGDLASSEGGVAAWPALAVATAVALSATAAAAAAVAVTIAVLRWQRTRG